MTGLLTGVRVLDFGRYIAGPYAACLLGDLGAEVIRIERVGGGDDRFVFPMAGDEGGANYLAFNRNKKSLTLDLVSPEGRQIVRELVETADVVIVNLPPRLLQSVGLDYQTLKAIKPSIILTTPTAFGMTGPLADKVGFDGIAQAMSGLMWMTGEAGSPTKAYGPWVDTLTASFSAFATLAAVMWQRQTGEGQHVQTDLLKSALVPAGPLLAEEATLRKGRTPSGNRSQTGGPADMVRTRDGFVYIHVVGNQLFERFCAMIGDRSLLGDARFKDDASRSKHGALLTEILQNWCSGQTSEEILRSCETARLPAGPVLAPREVLNLEHLKETGAFAEMPYTDMPSPAPVVTAPFKLSATPTVSPEPAPTIGADTDHILAELGRSGDDIASLRARGIV